MEIQEKIILCLSLIAFQAIGQTLNSSKVFATTCYNKHECFAYNENGGSFLFYNQESHELFVIIDFKKLKIGNDTLDEWVKDLTGTKLVFKGELNAENLLVLSQHNTKEILVNGAITFNGVTNYQSIVLTLFEVSEQGLLNQNNGKDYYDRLKANLQFAIRPKEFLIHKKEHHLKKTISIFIYNGSLNKVSPETEFMLKH